MIVKDLQDQRELWKEVRHGTHYGLGTQVTSTMLSLMESSMRSKLITTGGCRYGMSGMAHPSKYAQMKFRHTLSNRNSPDLTHLWLAKIPAVAKRQAYLMRKQQMLPLTFFNGGKYLWK